MNKYCWITGASKGIGKATTISFVKRGFNVIASSRSKEDLLNLKKDCEKLQFNGQIIPLALDVTDIEQLEECIKYIKEDIKKLDIIIFNAGTYIKESGQELSFKNTKLMMDLNFNSIINAIILLKVYFSELGVRQIVVVSSIAGWRGMPLSAIYSASKSALRTAMESFALDFSEKNIRFRVISPGFVDTPLTKKNNFYMPFLMNAEKAGEKIFKFVVFSNKFEKSFPLIFSIIMKIITTLPWSLYKLIFRKNFS